MSHIIDLVMRLMDKDVNVMRRANRWTDHRLVRAKLRSKLPHTCAGSTCSGSFSVFKLALASNRDANMKHLGDFLCNYLYRADQCNEDNWQYLQYSIVQVAE